MKIIDKTPLQDEKGAISFTNRVQGSLKFGLNWFAELEAQKVVIAQLDRTLEKSFILVRNFTLPNSSIVIPLILIGMGGISVIYVTNSKGQFEAKGDQWNEVNNGKPQPAKINLLGRVAKLSRALQKYLETQKIDMPSPVEAVLIASDPGAHIETMRPVARVVMSDAIKQYAGTLIKTRPIWSVEAIHDIADRIVNPRPPEKLKSAAPAEPPLQPAARAKAIFDASETAKPFDANDLGFSFDEESKAAPPSQPDQNYILESNPVRPAERRPQAAPKSRKILGITMMQVFILAFILICGCVVVGGLGYYVLYLPK